MRNTCTVLLAFLFSLSATAQTTTLVDNMVSVINNQSLAQMTSLLTKDGYTEVSNPVFAQKNLRVFKKKDTRGDEAYILEYCGSTLAGYYTTLSRSERLLLTIELEKKGFKQAEDNYNRHQKGDIAIEMVSDGSVVRTWEQSDTYGKPTHYVHVTRRSTCGQSGLAISSEREFVFHPSSLQSCLANLKLKQSEVVAALAKSAYFVGAADVTTGVEQYVKDDLTINLRYCEGVVKAFVLLLPKPDGEGLEGSLKKESFKMTQEQKGGNNAFVRVYETDTYAAVLTYYGDARDEDSRAYAYQLAFARKNTACK